MVDLDAYLKRIGYAGSRAPTLDTLRALHLNHALSIPFENVDVLRGVPIELDDESLERKLVRAGRGGYCFEHNLLFARVLAAVGFSVQRLVARVLWQRPDDGTQARTHMLLFVQLGEGGYICDVGFGGLTLTGPLRLEPDVEQATPHEPFRVRRDGREFILEVRIHGEWRPQYRFDLQEQRDVDIEVLSYYVSTHPASPFRSRLMAALVAEDRRFLLRDREFAVYHSDGRQERLELETVPALRATLGSAFGIRLPDEADVDAALGRVL
jgi:N-hydroxyarylamine O-acetyltransferase